MTRPDWFRCCECDRKTVGTPVMREVPFEDSRIGVCAECDAALTRLDEWATFLEAAEERLRAAALAYADARAMHEAAESAGFVYGPPAKT